MPAWRGRLRITTRSSGKPILLRTRYRNLQKTVNETNVQLASLQTLASEISVATGFKQKMEGPTSIAAEGKLAPTYSESLQEYYFLRSVSGFKRNAFSQRFHPNAQPSIWPVNGRLEDGFGRRIDPFSGEGAHHTGADIIAPTGTVVRATGDGVVSMAEWSGGYGRLVIVDHGNGIHTYYAHLSKIMRAARPGNPAGRNRGTGGQFRTRHGAAPALRSARGIDPGESRSNT